MKSKCVSGNGNTNLGENPTNPTSEPQERTTTTDPSLLQGHLQDPSKWVHSVTLNGLEELLKGNKQRIDWMDERGHTLLHLAILANRIEIVQLLINLGANVTLANRDGWSPLHIAAYSGNSDMISFLLQNKL